MLCDRWIGSGLFTPIHRQGVRIARMDGFAGPERTHSQLHPGIRQRRAIRRGSMSNYCFIARRPQDSVTTAVESSSMELVRVRCRHRDQHQKYAFSPCCGMGNDGCLYLQALSVKKHDAFAFPQRRLVWLVWVPHTSNWHTHEYVEIDHNGLIPPPNSANAERIAAIAQLLYLPALSLAQVPAGTSTVRG